MGREARRNGSPAKAAYAARYPILWDRERQTPDAAVFTFRRRVYVMNKHTGEIVRKGGAALSRDEVLELQAAFERMPRIVSPDAPAPVQSREKRTMLVVGGDQLDQRAGSPLYGHVARSILR